MTTATAPRGVRVLARAKLNLFLRILARETSGYHTLETLFTLIDLADEITVERAEGDITLTVEGAETGPPEENLVVKAARLVLGATGQRGGLRIHLRKRIPVKAGLGGGSSDGAATLHAVNAVFGNPVPRHEILQLSARLGSDVPFFASQAPLALAWGRGERLFRLPAPPSAPALLVIPEFGVSTPEAFGLVAASRKPDATRGAVALDLEAFSSWGGIGRLGGNDFEAILFAEKPRLREIFEVMAATRPLLVRMSGSGSALAAIYRSETDREEAVRTIPATVGTVVRAATLPQIPQGDSVFL